MKTQTVLDALLKDANEKFAHLEGPERHAKLQAIAKAYHERIHAEHVARVCSSSDDDLASHAARVDVQQPIAVRASPKEKTKLLFYFDQDVPRLQASVETSIQALGKNQITANAKIDEICTPEEVATFYNVMHRMHVFTLHVNGFDVGPLKEGPVPLPSKLTPDSE